MAEKLKIGLGMVAATAADLCASPAVAGRCGHSYPVDSPTTLAKVARACNVSLSALREANTGVDPSYVSPGEHLAIPDEIDQTTDIPSGGADLGVAGNYGDTPIYRYAEYSEPSYSEPGADTPAYSTASLNESQMSPVYVSTSEPYFVRASALGAPATMREDKSLSYQQRSAARIRNAGLPALRQTPVMSLPASRPSSKAVMVSTRGDMLYGDPLSPLMECAVLRRTSSGKIAQVREFKPLPEGRNPPAHCAEITNSAMTVPMILNDKVQASDFLRSEYEGRSEPPIFTVLHGYVSNADAECITVRADDGMVWRVGVPLAPAEMLGKDATIWAELTDSPVCGGLTMNRAVYAEQIR